MMSLGDSWAEPVSGNKTATAAARYTALHDRFIARSGFSSGGDHGCWQVERRLTQASEF
jgi:hypothetical protein